ncbi:TetR/AcrR family transcriptional regulator [Rhodococcus opacus]|uniref:HTH tetR-type domain-containing protein n=1 Tax=Rhodococcus opacus TaxID=37919 RepID=A0A076F0H8_RHOOP|nr:TetR/AcrR family transcriptional regulator [Rhodococcus opacus]AII10932.1 hypothetical protein EP51_43185 [Rhodococcus opacus]
MAEPVRRTQRERVEASTRLLAEATVSLIAERGFAATTTAEICKRAGYSRAMVHARYGSKDALLDSILTTHYEERMDIAPDPALNGLQQVLARIDAFSEFAAEDGEFLRAVFVLQFEATRGTAELRQRVATWVDRERQGFIHAIQNGVDDGSIRADLHAIHEATDLIASGIGIAYLWVTDATDTPIGPTLGRWRSRVASRLHSRPSVDEV